MMAIFWRHGLLEHVEHIIADFGQYPGDLAWERHSSFTKKALRENLHLEFSKSDIDLLVKVMDYFLIIKKEAAIESWFIK